MPLMLALSLLILKGQAPNSPPELRLVVQSGLAYTPTRMAFSPDHSLLAGIAILDLVIWETKPGRQLESIPDVDAFVFDRDNSILVAGSGSVRRLSARNLSPTTLPAGKGGSHYVFDRSG